MFDYKWVTTKNNPSKEEVEDLLNPLGAEGYRVIECLRVVHTERMLAGSSLLKFLLEKQTEE